MSAHPPIKSSVVSAGTGVGFGSSVARFPDAKQADQNGRKKSIVRRANKIKAEETWDGAALYIRKKPWPKKTAKPKNALVLVEKIIPGNEGEEDEIKYDAYFYNKKGQLIDRLQTTITLDNGKDFTSDYAQIKDLVAGEEAEFKRNAQGLVPVTGHGYLISDIIEVVRARARNSKKQTYGIKGAIAFGLTSAGVGILHAAGLITLPAWAVPVSIGAGGATVGYTLCTLYYEFRNRFIYEVKSGCSSAITKCCSCIENCSCKKGNSNTSAPQLTVPSPGTFTSIGINSGGGDEADRESRPERKSKEKKEDERGKEYAEHRVELAANGSVSSGAGTVSTSATLVPAMARAQREAPKLGAIAIVVGTPGTVTPTSAPASRTSGIGARTSGNVSRTSTPSRRVPVARPKRK